MAFNADLQILTQPVGTGNQTYSLAADFDPKAVILWAVPMTADGTAASWAYAVGFGTYRSSAVVQRCRAMRSLDGAGNADLATGQSTDALLYLHTQSAGSAVRDLEIDLVSMASGASSNVVLNWVNVHTTASIRVFMLVLGGSDITDALVGSFNMPTATATQDVTVVAGFGKPELLFFLGSSDIQWASANDFANVDVNSFMFGWGKQGEAGACIEYSQDDGNAASVTGMRQRSNKCILAQQWGSDLAVGQLDTTVANWPTDGFQIDYDANPILAGGIAYLALRTTAQITTGVNTAPTSGTPTVNQDNDAGFVPKLGMVFGWNQVAGTTMVTTGASLGAFGIGAYDGTDQAWAGLTEDDAAANMDSNNQQETDHILANYDQAAALTSSAVGSFSGNNLRLGWDDIDGAALQYCWLAMGDAPSTGADITASISGAATIVAAMTIANPIAAVLAGAGSLSATVTALTGFNATLAGAGTMAANVTMASPIAAVLAGTGTLAADVTVLTPISAVLSGAGTLNAATTVQVPLSASLSGVASLTADVDIEGQVDISANLAGAGSLSAEVTITAVEPPAPAPEPTPATVGGGFTVGISQFIRPPAKHFRGVAYVDEPIGEAAPLDAVFPLAGQTAIPDMLAAANGFDATSEFTGAATIPEMRLSGTQAVFALPELRLVSHRPITIIQPFAIGGMRVLVEPFEEEVRTRTEEMLAALLL